MVLNPSVVHNALAVTAIRFLVSQRSPPGCELGRCLAGRAFTGRDARRTRK